MSSGLGRTVLSSGDGGGGGVSEVPSTLCGWGGGGGLPGLSQSCLHSVLAFPLSSPSLPSFPAILSPSFLAPLPSFCLISFFPFSPPSFFLLPPSLPYFFHFLHPLPSFPHLPSPFPSLLLPSSLSPSPLFVVELKGSKATGTQGAMLSPIPLLPVSVPGLLLSAPHFLVCR